MKKSSEQPGLPPLRVAVMGSGKGSNFAALLNAKAAGRLHVEFCAAATDNPDSRILALAENANIPRVVVKDSQYRTRLSESAETWLAQQLLDSKAELIVLAGWMRVLKAPLLTPFAGRIINIHPSLLPQFPGLRAWEQALAAKVSHTGCTVHWVDAGVDTGPIIAQLEVPVLPGDTPETLHARIQSAEHRLLPEVVEWIAQNRRFLPWNPASPDAPRFPGVRAEEAPAAQAPHPRGTAPEK